jgi:hypothetical protein
MAQLRSGLWHQDGSNNRFSKKSNSNKSDSFHKKPGRLVAGKSCGMSHIMVEFMGPICPQLAPHYHQLARWHGKAKHFSLIESNCKRETILPVSPSRVPCDSCHRRVLILLWHERMDETYAYTATATSLRSRLQGLCSFHLLIVHLIMAEVLAYRAIKMNPAGVIWWYTSYSMRTNL